MNELMPTPYLNKDMELVRQLANKKHEEEIRNIISNRIKWLNGGKEIALKKNDERVRIAIDLKIGELNELQRSLGITLNCKKDDDKK